MTLKEYEEFTDSVSEDKFAEWFKDSADNFIDIGSIELPCYKLTDSKVVLRDRTVYSTDKEKIKEFEDNEHKISTHDNTSIMTALYTLDVSERSTIRYFLKLCLEKSRLIHEKEEEINEAECEFDRKHAKCSFCGKKIDEFPDDGKSHMIKGRSGIYICRECSDRVQDTFKEAEVD